MKSSFSRTEFCDQRFELDSFKLMIHIDIKTIKLVSRMNEIWDNYFILKITNGVKY